MPSTIFEGYSSAALDVLAANWDKTFSVWENAVAKLGVRHNESAGAYREHLVREMLTKFVPRRFEVATGFALRQERHAQKPLPTSSQLDLIVWDRHSLPPYMQEGGLAIVPVEGIALVTEVKARLDETELLTACRACCALKKLCHHPWELRFVVFAFELRARMPTLFARLKSWLRKKTLPPAEKNQSPMDLPDALHLPDLVVCVRKGQACAQELLVCGINLADPASPKRDESQVMLLATKDEETTGTRVFLGLVADTFHPAELAFGGGFPLDFGHELRRMCKIQNQSNAGLSHRSSNR